MLGLNTGLNDASVHEYSWLHAFELHLVDDVKDLIDLTHLLIDLGKDRVCHVARFDLEFLHILIAFECHLLFIGLEAAIQERVVEHLICLDSLLEHGLVQN